MVIYYYYEGTRSSRFLRFHLAWVYQIWYAASLWPSPQGYFDLFRNSYFLLSFWLLESALDLYNFPIARVTMRGPAVHDFPASIWLRFTKSGIQLPYDHPPRGISIYFEIPVFYWVFDFWNLPWTCKIYSSPWVLWDDLWYTISPLPFALGLPNLEYNFLISYQR